MATDTLNSPVVERWREPLRALETSCASLSVTEIDELHSAAVDCLVRIRRNRNAMLPVNRIPPEILLCVFYLLPRASVDGDRVVWNFSIFSLEDVVWLSAVCTHWRDIALSSAVLWRCMNFDITQTFLQRTRHAPLACQLGPSINYTHDRKIALFLEVHGARIQELHLAQPDPGSPIEYCSGLDGIEVLSARNMSFLPAFLCQSTSRLRSIAMSYCTKAPTCMLPCLTQLSLVSIDKRLPVHEMRDLLSRCPTLQDLHLTNCLAFTTDIQADTRAVIRMKQLRRIRIADHAQCTSALLSGLSLERGMTIRTNAYRISDTTASDIFQVYNSEPFLKLAIIMYYFDLTIIATGESSGVSHEWREYFIGRRTWPLQLLTDLVSRHQPRDLWLIGDTNLEQQSLIYTLPESLETLWVSLGSLEGLLVPLDALSCSSLIPCPHLRTLHIVAAPDTTYTEKKWSDALSLLIALIARRKEAGNPISEVILHGNHYNWASHLGHDKVKSLKKVVHSVEIATNADCRMKMPAICTSKDGSWWSSWNYLFHMIHSD